MKNKIIITIIALLLMVGTLFLILIQFQSADWATKVTAGTINKNLQLSFKQSVEGFHKELNNALSSFFFTKEDYTRDTMDDFYTRLEAVKTQTGFSEYLEEIYLFIPEGKGAFFSYSEDAGLFIPSDNPETLKSLPQAAQDNYIRKYIEAYEDKSLYFIPVFDEEAKDKSSLWWIIVDLDMEIICSKILPEDFKQELEYPFEIRFSGKTYYSSSEITGNHHYSNRKPDFILPLDFLTPGYISIGSKESRDILKYYIAPQKNTIFNLAVYYPDGPFVETMTRQSLINKIVGIGVLVLLLCSILFLYRLYLHTKKTREKEQAFVSAITHDLRTPIAVIQASSSNLAKGIVKDGDKITKYGEIIQGQAKRLSHMVENILVYSGLEGRKRLAENQIQLTDPVEIIKKVISGIDEFAQGKNIDIIFKTDAYRGKIKTEPSALASLIENLVVNAIRHGTKSSDEKDEIRIFIKKRIPKGTTIIIEDNGPGIPEKEQKKLFTPFTRGEKSADNQVPGSGLGLYLVKRIAKALGGTIQLESPYRQINEQLKPGCRFRLDLFNEVIDG